MNNFDDGILRIAALLVTGLLGAWTAWACHRAQLRGVPGADALVWFALAAVFILYAQVRLARDLGWLQGWGGWLRTFARQHHLYADRRSFQIVVTVVVAIVAIALLLYGLIWFWHYIKRYRLAIGLAAFIIGYAFIRLVSLHEVDSWNADHPWAPLVAELVAAGGASAVAIIRLHQLREFAQFWGSG